MARKYQNLNDFLSQPGQTVVALMRQFNQKRREAGKPQVGIANFYGWCNGTVRPTKEWDLETLSELTGIDKKKLFG